MVQLLLALCGTRVEQTEGEGGVESRGSGTSSLPELQADCATLSDTLTKFTKLLTRYTGLAMVYSTKAVMHLRHMQELY